jgi:hypothetical protein
LFWSIFRSCPPLQNCDLGGHAQPRGGERHESAQHDEAYDAFVTMYRDNSDFKSAYDVCVPNGFLK